jgi:hypothetical protein
MTHGMKKLIPALAIGLLMSLPFRLRAAESKPVETPPWYQFEVIVFERINKGAGSTEAWPSNPAAPSPLDAIPFDTRGKGTLRNNEPIPYRPLPAEEQWLGGIWSRFRNSRNYRPLYHVAWRQQVVDPERAQKLYVYLPPEDGATAGPNNPPLLEGFLKVGVKHYLHVEADLMLRRRVAATDAAPGSGSAFFSAPEIAAYRLHETSRMRSGKLYYLDHPVLGVLVQAEKYTPPVPKPEPPAAPEPLAPVTPSDAQPTAESAQTPQ